MKVQSKLHLDRSREVQGLTAPERSKDSWGQLTDKLFQVVDSSSGSKLPTHPSGNYLAEMFKLQVQMNKLHMRVELCSKVAESASTSIKKLQQVQ